MKTVGVLLGGLGVEGFFFISLTNAFQFSSVKYSVGPLVLP